MKDSFKAGLVFEEKFAVDVPRTISFMGEELRVYSTPSMVLDVETACRNSMVAHHDAGEDSVGARVEIDHQPDSRTSRASARRRVGPTCWGPCRG